MDLTQINPDDKRSKTIKELYTSELLYINNLTNMIEGFVIVLKENRLISNSDISGIFSNLETILRFHQEYFLPPLEKEVKQWGEESLVGNIFSSLSPCFKLYTQYCSNYDNAIALVQENKKSNEDFNQFLIDAQKSDKFGGSYITSLLILPIQRIPRYEMFLGDLVKRTNEDHPDYETLASALESVSKKAFEINEACERAENIVKIIEVSKKIGIDGSLVSPGRSLIREDVVQEEKLDSSSKIEKTCFLFSDIIIVSQEKKSKCINNTIDLLYCWVRDMTKPESCQVITPEGTLIFSFEDEGKQKAWVKDFSSALRKRISGKKAILESRAKFQIVDSSIAGVFTLQKQKDLSNDEALMSPTTRKKRWGILDQFKSKKRRETDEGGSPLSKSGERKKRKSLPHDANDKLIPKRATSTFNSHSHSSGSHKKFKRSTSTAALKNNDDIIQP